MKRIVYLIIISFFTIVNFSFAQLKKANEYYNNFEYVKAIQLYKKIIEKNNTTEALEKIALSYLKIKNYVSAEKYFAELIKKENVAPINYFYYGIVLKNNNKVEEAKAQFEMYSTKAPSDKLAEVSLKSCEQIKLWVLQAKQFEIKSLAKINSIYSDFCPTYFRNDLVFVSERTKDMVNYENYSWNKRSYLNVYSGPIKMIKDSAFFGKRVYLFSSSVNTDYHDGPVCFNTEQNTMYFTRVINQTSSEVGFINRPQLYITTLKKGNKWNSAKPFKYNNPAYSYAHPSVSADGKQLYFASDKPGGKGGMDIYVCEKEGDEWGAPENLGDEVNTFQDELFPYIRKDDVFYFSSNGQPGFGGLDIFSATIKDGKFKDVKNLGTPLNSSTDDFGIIFNQENTKGYFSSDREGGKGNDDIYSFSALSNFITVQGKILFNKDINDPAKNASVLLLKEDGKVIKITTTDDKGFFKFENLSPDAKYMVKLDADDPNFAGKKQFYMADENDSLIRVTVFDQKGNKFTFKNLPADKNHLTQVGSEDDISIAGNLLYGEDASKPLENTKVNLINERGVIVQTTTTNAFGAFVFSKLPNDENFIVRVDETDAKLAVGTKIVITNKNGKHIQVTEIGADGKFKFTLLANEQNGLALMMADDVELRLDFRGKLVSEKQIPFSNSKVNLVNKKGDVLQSVKTDDKGGFLFSNLDYSQDILIAIDENDPLYKTFEKLFFMDEKGNIIRAFTKINGKLRFVLLPYEKNRLAYVYVDDPWLQVIQLMNEAKKEQLTIVESIYYNYDDYKILPGALTILDKVVNVMKNDPQVVIELSAHTDSRSTAKYNLILSQKRANTAVEYIVSKGITKDRITGVGLGESKILNKCVDGVECTEEEHSKNRRTEFKIKRK